MTPSSLNMNTFIHYAKTQGLGSVECANMLHILSVDKYTKEQKKSARKALQLSAKYHWRHMLVVEKETKYNDRVFSKASNKRLYFWAQNKNSPV